MKIAITTAVTLGLALFAWVIDLPKDFGAHPWWSQQVVLAGAVIGLISGSVLQWVLKGHRLTPLVLLVGAIAGFGLAKYGQTQFAASFAEDALAGKLWFFGWHITTAFSFATLTAIGLIRR